MFSLDGSLSLCFRYATAAAVAAGLAAGCAADTDSHSRPDSTASAPGATSSALRIGDSGPEVERLHEYLYRYGYFPNAELSQQYPAWHPAVPDEPENHATFDIHTRDALLAFQHTGNLLETGVGDEATLALMAQPRCGVPDEFGSEEDKWAVFSRRWGTTALTYSIDNSKAPKDKSSAITTQVNAAARAWQTRSGYTLSSVSSNGKIKIGWADLGKSATGATILGSAGPVVNGSGTVTGYNITFTTNSGIKWTFGENPLNSDITDYYTVLLHELGHALGLDHSSVGSPVMFFSIGTGVARNLTPDDIQGVHALQPGHFGIDSPDYSGTATSIVSGENGTLWITGGVGDSNGYPIYQRDFTNATWTEHPYGGRAVQVAVTEGDGIWHINAQGNMYRNGASGWLKKTNNLASVIAASGNQVWHLGKAVTRGTRDHDIFQWNGKSWDQIWGQASDIALTKVNGEIQVWYINESGEVYKQIPGHDPEYADPQMPGGACGISAGSDGTVFALQCPYNTNGMPIYMLNLQDGTDRAGTGSDTPTRKQWTRIQGEARDVTETTARFGNPATQSVIYHVGTNGIYQSH